MLGFAKFFRVYLKLKRHIDSVHEGLKNHNCETCGKDFNLKSTLRRHIRNVHEGLKNHKCDLCVNAFTCKADLKAHIANVHEGKNNWFYAERQNWKPIAISIWQNSVFKRFLGALSLKLYEN